jgi:glycosyltransferase involved in cell wall biosynthesis
MKRILAFCFFPAFVPPSNGGQSRLFNFYRALSRWHHVTLLTSTHIGVQEELIYHGLNFVERRIPKDDQFVSQYALLEKYSSGGDLSGPAIAACGNLPTLLHRAYLEEYEKADILIHDFPFTVDYDLFADFDKKPRVYNAHNCETKLYEQLHPGNNSRYIHDLVRGAEQRMLSKVDLVLFCNEHDLDRFRDMEPDAKFEALYAPNGMSPVGCLAERFVSKNNAFRAVFMGSGHPPNARAAEFIVQSLVPSLPDILFDIVGSCLPEGAYPANLVRHGIVDEATKERIFGNANLALNPMSDGSGSNVKVLDYFAHGLPVLSTPFGMRGIKAKVSKEYLESSLEDFTESLHRIADGSLPLAEVGAAGRALALENYTWDSIISPLVHWLTERDKKDQAGEAQEQYVLALNDYDSFARVGGGCTRTQGIYKAVSDWSPVVFVCFSDDESLGVRKHEDGITIINVPQTSEHVADIARVNALFHVAADDIVASRHCKSNPWLSLVYGILRQSARSIVVEHCYMAELPLAWGDRFVYSSQNNETALKNFWLKYHPLQEELLSQIERIERLAVERSVATVAVSLDDAQSLVKGKQAAGEVIVVPNGAVMQVKDVADDRVLLELRKQVGMNSAVFLGSAHMPNIEAANFIVDKMAPRCPEVHFHLIGAVCDGVVNAPPNVHLWGEVDEETKVAVMQSCALALNPVVSGSGSNVKMADYLGRGLFVVTTEFGLRGYSERIQEHVEIVSLDEFVNSVQTLMLDPTLCCAETRASRTAIFCRELSMSIISKKFVDILKRLETRKKRVLFVTYRYTDPMLGGAEIHIEKFIRALGNSGHFDIDVVAPSVSGIHNHMRFSESYSFDPELAVPVDIPNVRFTRFLADAQDAQTIDDQLRKAWSVQPGFEKVLDQELQAGYRESGLTWGWGYPEGEGVGAGRWAFTACSVHLSQAGRIDLDGTAPHTIVTTAYSGDQIISGPWTLEGNFSLTFFAEAGEVHLVTSAARQPVDPRPLGFRLSRLQVDGHKLDLSAPTLLQRHLTLLPANQCFQLLDQAAEISRVAMGVRLTDGRGPWSIGLENFIEDHVAKYDLVVTHNNVFRPAVIAIAAAKKHGVPSILIPHAHLDDDFYHFPDWMASAREASLVLAAPESVCEFLGQKGCNVRYLPAGCDATEPFTSQDQEAFRLIHPSPRPFVLVLGRKAGAKGYREIIDAVEQLNREGVDLQVVLIGPDDDGLQVDSPNAVYLGRQPRDVVRGALLSCFALCNMSSSESFGIVLLEAWLAGKPVIANKHCAAFRDMAVDGENALLVDHGRIPDAIKRLISQPELGGRLAQSGKRLVARFDWRTVAGQFVGICSELVKVVKKTE